MSVLIWRFTSKLMITQRPVSRFSCLKGQNTFLGGQDFCFCYMFKINYFEHNEIWGAMPPDGYGPGSRYKKFEKHRFTQD